LGFEKYLKENVFVIIEEILENNDQLLKSNNKQIEIEENII
jgi:hypothetical protein